MTRARLILKTALTAALIGTAIWCASVIALPVLSGNESKYLRMFLVVATAIFFLLPFALRKIPPPTTQRYVIPAIRRIGFLLPAIAIGIATTFEAFPPSIALAMLVLMIVSFCLFRAHEELVPECGIISLLFTIGMAVTVEMSLDALPAKSVRPEIATTPPLLDWTNRGEVLFAKNGFRGRFPCKDCTNRPLRIFAMGGSSTYGIPMYYTLTTYSAVLERILRERRPGERFEVFNAGVPGFGVIQVLDAINRVILPYRPDIITVNVGFNDQGRGIGWYGGLGHSDFDGYMRMRFFRWLQDWTPYRAIHDTRLYAWARLALVNAQKSVLPFFATKKKSKELQLRSTPEEFREGLRRIAKLGRKNDFLPVFIPEPMNRTRNLAESIERSAYQRALWEVALEEGVPVVDSLSALHEYESGWLFYDLIHPNEATHRVLAETIYRDLFLAGGQTEWGRRFFDSRGMMRDSPNVKRSPEYHIEREKLVGKNLCAELRAPFAKGHKLKASVLLDGDRLLVEDDVSEPFKVLNFQLPRQSNLPPLVDIQITARHQLDFASKLSTQIPFHFQIASSTYESNLPSYIKIRDVRSDPKSEGYNVLLIDSRTGVIRAMAGFPVAQSKKEAEKLFQFLESAQSSVSSDAVLVAITTRGDAVQNVDTDRLSKLLRAFGGSGEVPRKDEAFLFVGTTKTRTGNAIEMIGGPHQQIEIGDASWSAAELLEVRSIVPCSSEWR